MFAEAFAAISIDPLDPRDPQLRKIFGGGGRTESGAEVTEDTAMKLAAFWRGINLIAETMGKVPLVVVKDMEDGGKVRDKSHPLYPLVRYNRPAGFGQMAEQGASVFRKTLQAHADVWGNGYAHIFRDSSGTPIELVILLPDRTKPIRGPNGELLYQTKIAGRNVPLLPENVIHIRGLTWDGVMGYNTVEQNRETIGADAAARLSGARFFGKGMQASGILMTPSGLNEDEEKAFEKSFNEAKAGLGNSHKVILLEEGAKFQALTIPPEAAQFLQTKEFGLLDIANVIGIPPHKIGHTARTAYNSLEQENQSFLDDAIDGRMITWEEELNEKLLTEEEKASESHRIEFMREALKRLDARTETEVMIMELNNGGLQLDEYRRIRNRPSAPNGIGKKFRRPANIVNEGDEQLVKQIGQQGQEKPPGNSPQKNPTGNQGGSVVIRDAVARVSRRFAAQARKASKSGKEFCEWVDGCQEANIEVCSEIMGPASACILGTDDAGKFGSHAKALAYVLMTPLAAVFVKVSEEATADNLKSLAEFAAAKVETADWVAEQASGIEGYTEPGPQTAPLVALPPPKPPRPPRFEEIEGASAMMKAMENMAKRMEAVESLDPKAPIFNLTLPEKFLIDHPAPILNVAAPEVIVNVPETVINLPAPIVNHAPREEYDIIPERDAEGRAIRFKRVPKGT